MTHKSNPALRYFLELFRFSVLPQRLQKYIDLIRNDRFQPYLIVAFTLWLVGAVEIVQKTTGQRLDPRFWMIIAILITAYSGARIFRLASPLAIIGRSSRSWKVDNL